VTQRVFENSRNRRRAKRLPCIRSLQIEGSQEFIFDLIPDMPKIMAVGCLVQKRSAARRLQALTSFFATRLWLCGTFADPERRSVLISLRSLWVTLGNEESIFDASRQGGQVPKIAQIHAELLSSYKSAMN